jgi:uracil-DNA glycosylase family 4
LFSIKSSKFSDCFSCKLLNCPSCILETNCQDDLSKVDIIIVAENPGKNEVETGIPLIGKSGKTFRKYFDKYLRNLNYLITNVVLCQTIDEKGNTGNPDDETIEKCKNNLLALIDICKPKLIFCMGSSPAAAFDIKKVKMTEVMGKVIKWNNYDILLTIHPSYVNRKKHEPEIEEAFESHFIKAARLLGSNIVEEEKKITVSDLKGVQYYKIPEKYYTDDYRLIDVHYSSLKKQVIYIFRDKNNKKIFHTTNDQYYCYQTQQHVDNRPVVKYDDLNPVVISYDDRKRLTPTNAYEGDIKINDKHIIDYFIHNKAEASDTNLNIYYFDIEVDPGEFKGVPNSEEAEFPINLITVRYHGKTTTYVLDNGSKINKIEDVDLKIFKTEKSLLSSLLSDLESFAPDIITGWNVIGFDLCYIYNRLPKVGLDQSKMSPFQDVYISKETGYANIPGYVIVEMMNVYKEFQLKARENYKLGTIAQIEIGETKLQFDGSFSDFYRNDINKFIEYNIRDTLLLEKLENKIKFLKLLNELRRICSGSYKTCETTQGRLDCLVTRHLKVKGFGSRNSQNLDKIKFPGAYVQEPITGIHNYIVDFDYKSLYPNLVRTYNIGVNTFLMKFENSHFGYDLAYDINNLPDRFNIVKDPLYKKEIIEYTKEQLLNEIKENNLVYTINGCFYKNHNTELSFYSEILGHLLSSRDEYKQKMLELKALKDFENVELYDIRQKTYKVLANALYGILGTNSYRFFNVDMASSITLSGQEAIKNSIIHAEKYMDNLKRGIKEDIDIIISKDNIYTDTMDVKLKYVITSDTDSILATLSKFIKSKDYEMSIQEMKDICSDIQNFINKQVVLRIINRHNVPIDKNRLEIKNELMCSRGLFVSKKHYALYVIFQENKRVDEMTITGLEIKRRDFSSYTKECMKELLDIILKSEKISFNQIMSYVKEKEVEFIRKIRSGDKTVARPIGWKRKLDEYKVIPQGVISMFNWNDLLYNTFECGTRGYLYKLNGIDLSKAPKEVIENYNKRFVECGKVLETMCIPDEINRLPEYFIPDVKDMLRFHWTDRYTQLLEPMMKPVVSMTI